MNPPLVVGLFVLITFSSLSSAQFPATNLTVSTAPPKGPPQAATTEKASSQLSVPIVADYPNQILTLTVEGPARMHFPTAVAANIFAEIVRGLTREINSTRPVAVHLDLLVRVGGNRNYLELIYGSPHDAVIALSEWNDTVFSRLAVRAVRGCVLTDQQLDEVARTAVERAHARVDVTELKAR